MVRSDSWLNTLSTHTQMAIIIIRLDQYYLYYWKQTGTACCVQQILKWMCYISGKKNDFQILYMLNMVTLLEIVSNIYWSWKQNTLSRIIDGKPDEINDRRRSRFKKGGKVMELDIWLNESACCWPTRSPAFKWVMTTSQGSCTWLWLNNQRLTFCDYID